MSLQPPIQSFILIGVQTDNDCVTMQVGSQHSYSSPPDSTYLPSSSKLSLGLLSGSIWPCTFRIPFPCPWCLWLHLLLSLLEPHWPCNSSHVPGKGLPLGICILSPLFDHTLPRMPGDALLLGPVFNSHFPVGIFPLLFKPHPFPSLQSLLTFPALLFYIAFITVSILYFQIFFYYLFSHSSSPLPHQKSISSWLRL